MNASNILEFFMSRALVLAAKGRPSPNPYVGAVIVKDGRIIGEGYHHAAGLDHAEVEAIKDVERKHGKKKAAPLLANSTLFVTLEPCAHFGRTPPCTGAVLRGKISRVVCAMRDPNRRVTGNGGAVLRKEGVRVEFGLMKEKAEALNRAYLHFCRTGRPYVTLKMAMTLDGKVATRTGDSKWVSGKESRRMVQRLRDEAGAVLVGAGTVIRDNPRLTCRMPGGRNPLRVIADGMLRIPLNAKVLADGRALIATGPRPNAKKMDALARKGIEVLCGPFRTPGHVKLAFVVHHLGARGINQVLCEGGPELAARLMEEKLVDEILFFIAPKIAGGRAAPGPVGGEGVAKMMKAHNVRFVAMGKMGDDFFIAARMGGKKGTPADYDSPSLVLAGRTK